MSVTTGNFVIATDLSDLATLANTKLAPTRAYVTSPDFTGYTPRYLTDGYYVSSSTNYSVGDVIWNESEFGSNKYGQRFACLIAHNDTDSGTSPLGTNAYWKEAYPIDTLNRIRFDLFNSIFTEPAFSLYKSLDALVSKQIVGINPPASFYNIFDRFTGAGGHNQIDVTATGKLFLEYAAAEASNPYFPAFKDVKFIYASADDPDGWMAGDESKFAGDESLLAGADVLVIYHKVAQIAIYSAGINWTETVQNSAELFHVTPLGYRKIYDKPYYLDWSTSLTAATACTMKVKIIIPLVWQGTGTAPTPVASDFEITSEFGFLEFSIESSLTGGWQLQLDIRGDVPSGTSDFNLHFKGNSYWLFGDTKYTAAVGNGYYYSDDSPAAPGALTFPSPPTTSQGYGDPHSVLLTPCPFYIHGEMTIDQSGAPVTGVPIIHPSSDGIELGISNKDPNGYSWGAFVSLHYLDLSIPDIKGVWVANTLPPPANNVILDYHLPSCVNQKLAFPSPDTSVRDCSSVTAIGGYPRSSQRIESLDKYPVTPCVPNTVAPWPVIRDTDDYPWNMGLDPYRYAKTLITTTLAPGGTVGDVSEFLGLGYAFLKDWKITAGAGVKVYVKRGVTASRTNYDFALTGGAITLASMTAFYGTLTDGFYAFAFENTASIGVIITGMIHFEYYNPYVAGFFETKPIFFPSNFYEESPGLQPLAVYEGYSFNLANDGGFVPAFGYDLKQIPQRGHCIYSVTVRRRAQLDVNGYYSPPAPTGAVAVTIGQWVGLTHTDFETISTGTFTALKKPDGTDCIITIPDGQQSAQVDVFWPVVWGTYLVWQSSADVEVEALANFQPVFHSLQYAVGSRLVNNSSLGRVENNLEPSGGLYWDYVFGSGTLKYGSNRMEDYTNHYYFGLPDKPDFAGAVQVHNRVTWPISASDINDLTTLLNLL